MHYLNLEFVDLVIFLIAAIAVGLWSLKTLPSQQQKALSNRDTGKPVRWPVRFLTELNHRELHAVAVGHGIAFFLMFMLFSLVKTQHYSYGIRFALYMLIALALSLIVPRCCVLVVRALNRPRS